jgi:hypothetical protein
MRSCLYTLSSPAEGPKRTKIWVRDKFAFTSAGQPAMVGDFMMDIDLATWGMIVVPLGVAICFGPALLVWVRDELRAGAAEKQNQDKKP